MRLEEKLENSLVMRNIRSDEDVVKFARFNAEFNNASEGATCELLLREHKGMTQEDFFLVEDTSAGEFLATICLIPWEISFEGIPIHAAMLEMVLSHPAHRKQGLVKRLILCFLAEVDKRGYEVSLITGIPNYYRQYGYTYAFDLGTSEILPAFLLPDSAKSPAGRYGLRNANQVDLGQLAKWHEENNRQKQVHVLRSDDHWRYLFDKAKFDIRIVEDTSTHAAVGYCLVNESADRKTIQIPEAVLPNHEVAQATLNLLRTDVTERIIIGCGKQDVLAQLVGEYGSVASRNTQWLIRTHDVVKFMNRIKPVFEKRLACAGCSCMSAEVIVNLFRYAIRLRIKEGKIESIQNVGFLDSSMGADGGDLCIPHDAFIRLLFGYRNLDELWDAWPDIVVKPEKKHIIEILLPKLCGHLYAPYHYQG